MLKKFKLLILTATLSTVTLSTSVFANEINYNDNIVSTKSIEVSELPNGVIPMYFNSEEQANLYFDKVVENLENTKTEELTIWQNGIPNGEIIMQVLQNLKRELLVLL